MRKREASRPCYYLFTPFPGNWNTHCENRKQSALELLEGKPRAPPQVTEPSANLAVFATHTTALKLGGSEDGAWANASAP